MIEDMHRVLSRKPLIVAGTYPRENAFSYAVADQLIAKFGIKEPDLVIHGMDQARQGSLWNYKEIAIGKISKTGETSTEYLQRLNDYELLALACFKIKHLGFEHVPGIDSRFGNVNQRTSVTDGLMRNSGADYCIDLHSYHNYSGEDGTALYIVPDAEEHRQEWMSVLVNRAKRDQPEIYSAENDNADCLSTDNMDGDIDELVAEWQTELTFIERKLAGCGKKEIIEILHDEIPENLVAAVFNLTHLGKRLSVYEEGKNRQLSEVWKRGWSLIENRRKPRMSYDRFTFEAIHWQQQQQDAVVNFICDYLI